MKTALDEVHINMSESLHMFPSRIIQTKYFRTNDVGFLPSVS
jgi:hypothetical protein